MFERMLDSHTLESKEVIKGEMPFNQDYLPAIWQEASQILSNKKES